MFFATKGKADEAETLCRRAVEMGEKALGYDHKRVAIRLHNLGKVCQTQVRTCSPCAGCNLKLS